MLGLRQTMSVNVPQGSYPTTMSQWGASWRHFISKLRSSYCQLASIRYLIQVNYRLIWWPLTCELHTSYKFFWSWIIPLALKGNAQVSWFQLFKLHAKINCDVPASTTPLVFEPGLIAHSESRASPLTNSAKGSDRWREASRSAGLSHSSLPQWHQTPLSGNPPFSPGQRETWQSVGSEWTFNALSFTPRQADEPPM